MTPLACAALLPAVFSVVTPSAPAETPIALLERLERLNANLVRSETTVHTVRHQGEATVETTTQLSVERDGDIVRFRREDESICPDAHRILPSLLVISDGTATWMYDDKRRADVTVAPASANDYPRFTAGLPNEALVLAKSLAVNDPNARILPKEFVRDELCSVLRVHDPRSRETLTIWFSDASGQAMRTIRSYGTAVVEQSEVVARSWNANAEATGFAHTPIAGTIVHDERAALAKSD